MLFVTLAAVAVTLASLIALVLSRRTLTIALTEAEEERGVLRRDLATEAARLSSAEEAKQAAERSLEKTVANVESLNSKLEAAKKRAKAAHESEQDKTKQLNLLEVESKHLREHASNIEPRVLWELELQRSERTWRHSVSILPDSDQSPFQEDRDLLRLAVEIEAAALKEEAGAFLTVDWQAAPVEDLARAHLILRLAQEMLAEAAREPIPVCLVASGTGAVTLSLEPAEEGDKGIEIDLRPPAVAGQLIELTDNHQAQVTINYA